MNHRALCCGLGRCLCDASTALARISIPEFKRQLNDELVAYGRNLRKKYAANANDRRYVDLFW